MERIRELLQSLTPYDLKEGQIHIGEPVVLPGANNTQVHVQGTHTGGTYGDRAFRYNRYDLGALPVRDVPYTGETSVAQLLASINHQPILTYKLQTAFGLSDRQGILLLADVINDSIDVPADGVQVTIPIKAAPQSYMYIGQLRIRITG